MQLPEKYGNWRDVYNRLRMWSADGTWARVFTALVAQADSDEPDDHAIGRSCGGLTTKIHIAADGNCRPLAFHLTAGQAGDAPGFADVLARLRAATTWTAPNPTRGSPRRQGVFVTGHP